MSSNGSNKYESAVSLNSTKKDKSNYSFLMLR